MAKGKDGKDTTEYQVTKASSMQMYITVILAVAVVYLPKVLEFLPEGGDVTAILVAVIAVLGIVQNLLVRIGYIRSRTTLKGSDRG